jgi:pilus assembly protein CpaF
MSPIEWIMSGILLTIISLFLYYIFKGKIDEEDVAHEKYSIDYLCKEVKKYINEIINMDIDVLRLNKKDLQSRIEMKRSLSDATRGCSHGDIHKKMIVFARIKNILAGPLGITEEVINEILPFHTVDQLTPTDMFEILLYLQKRERNFTMFRDISLSTDIGDLKTDEKGYYYDITEADIKEAFRKLCKPLCYDDKLNIITQRVYEETYGLSIVDMLIMEDDSVDSVSGGISGITLENYKYREEDIYCGSYRKPKTHESIWIIYSGKPIHLKFLSFQTNATIVRVCKNLSEHSRMGHFTSCEGGSKNHLVDGSRVTTFRPNNASQWAFFVRKFGSSRSYELKDLITDKGCQYPIGVLRWGLKGCINMVYSGDQNSGKTTNMRASIREIDRRQQIRTIEADFELYLNDAYYDMNILGTRPSRDMGFAKLIELLKASEAHTILFGETACLEHAKHLIDLLLAGSKRVITTGHWPTADELIAYFVLAEGGDGKSGAEDCERVVSKLINLDIHHVKDNDGHRHIDRITEIIPYERDESRYSKATGIEGKLDKIAYYLESMTRKKSYDTRDIIVYEDGEYHMINPISDRLEKIILRNLAPEERSLFLEFNQVSEGGAREAC